MSSLVAALLHGRSLFFACLLGLFCQPCLHAQQGVSIDYEQGPTVNLQSQRLTEASGLAHSRRDAKLVWSHNDSGDAAWLYGFNLKGEAVGRVFIKNVFAFDFEDMAAFNWQGKAMLLVADVGDNLNIRAVRNLHLVEEPQLNLRDNQKDDANKEQLVDQQELPVIKTNAVKTIRVAIPDNSDLEAVAVDAKQGVILLASKEPSRTRIYQIQLDSKEAIQKPKLIGQFKTRTITGMDISEDGQRLVMINYSFIYLFDRKGNESWVDVFKNKPAVKIKRQLAKCEAVCFMTDKPAILYTSEGKKPELKSIHLKYPKASPK